jgi:hypothetical protein
VPFELLQAASYAQERALSNRALSVCGLSSAAHVSYCTYQHTVQMIAEGLLRFPAIGDMSKMARLREQFSFPFFPFKKKKSEELTKSPHSCF